MKEFLWIVELMAVIKIMTTTSKQLNTNLRTSRVRWSSEGSVQRRLEQCTVGSECTPHRLRLCREYSTLLLRQPSVLGGEQSCCRRQFDHWRFRVISHFKWRPLRAFVGSRIILTVRLVPLWYVIIPMQSRRAQSRCLAACGACKAWANWERIKRRASRTARASLMVFRWCRESTKSIRQYLCWMNNSKTSSYKSSIKILLFSYTPLT